MASSDLNSPIVAELEAAYHWKTAQFFVTKRPWLDLYGVRVSPVAAFGSVSNTASSLDPALIHRVLPDELLHESWGMLKEAFVEPHICRAHVSCSTLEKRRKNNTIQAWGELVANWSWDEISLGLIFARLPSYHLGRAACVCRKWRYAIRNPIFWRIACLKAWQLSGVVYNYQILHSKYDGSWRKMWLSRPRVRTDGIYVSRNTYIRAGIAEWRVSNPVHLVCYYRYIKFYPSGRFLYKNSSQKLKDVAKIMNFRASKAECIYRGQYTLSDDKVEAALLYPGLRPTVLRIRLRLRGTTAGANNRMDLVSLVTSGVNDNEANHEEDMLDVVEGWQDDETHNPDVPAVSHSRGLTPFVFVPFEEVETSVVNLPVDKMDFFVPD